jgi:hypothetical protein
LRPSPPSLEEAVAVDTCLPSVSELLDLLASSLSLSAAFSFAFSSFFCFCRRAFSCCLDSCVCHSPKSRIEQFSRFQAPIQHTI